MKICFSSVLHCLTIPLVVLHVFSTLHDLQCVNLCVSAFESTSIACHHENAHVFLQLCVEK